VESHDFWEICYAVSGEVTLFLENKKLNVPEKHLVLVPPNKKHSYFSENGNQSRAFVICFDSFSHTLDAISGNLFSPDAVQLNCMDIIMEECATTFCMNESDHLEVLPGPRFGGQQALLLQLEYLLISLVRRMSVDKNSTIVFFSDENFYEDLTRDVLRFLRENVHKKLSLEDVCSKFSYSKSFLCKIFKEQTGKTLLSSFTDLKLEEAKKLLAETKQSVTGIACSLGFREVKYFDSIFKKHTGMTPVAWREKMQTLKQNEEKGEL